MTILIDRTDCSRDRAALRRPARPRRAGRRRRQRDDAPDRPGDPARRRHIPEARVHLHRCLRRRRLRGPAALHRHRSARQVRRQQSALDLDLLPRRRDPLGLRRLPGHADRRPRQRAHRRQCPKGAQPRPAHRLQLRHRDGHDGGRPRAARPRDHVPDLAGLPSARRVRLRCILNRALCPRRRRHLHQGRRCRRRPGRQDRGRHSRRRPPQSRHDRRQRRRQRRRCRRHGRRPVRVVCQLNRRHHGPRRRRGHALRHRHRGLEGRPVRPAHAGRLDRDYLGGARHLPGPHR